MSIPLWIVLGLIPGILAGLIVAHSRQSVRVEANHRALRVANGEWPMRSAATNSK